MKKIVSSILTLLLTIGIIFITTDCEVYFGEINHNYTSASIPVDKTSDVEYTHASHHMANDLFSETPEDYIQPDGKVSLNVGATLPSFWHNYFTSIWQPPKFS